VISNRILNPRALVAMLIAGALAAPMLIPAGSGAIVPPRNCGKMTVSGRTYNIKADQLRCPRARRYAKRYLTSRSKPAGYSCRTYTNSALKFRCSKGIRVYYAIRR
jgi:hypothetical protein